MNDKCCLFCFGSRWVTNTCMAQKEPFCLIYNHKFQFQTLLHLLLPFECCPPVELDHRGNCGHCLSA